MRLKVVVAASIAALLVLAIPAPSGAGAPVPAPPVDGNWLTHVNYYREMAGLLPVTEDPAFSDGAVKHARYMVKTGDYSHFEDPRSKWYTQEGFQAGTNSNIWVARNDGTPDKKAIKIWMQAPFHALGILESQTSTMGYGAYRQAKSPSDYEAGFVLDVGNGFDFFASAPTVPVLWPGAGTTTSLRKFTGESPDPLTACRGYETPAGLPIIVQMPPVNAEPDFPSDDIAPDLETFTISVNGAKVAACGIDSASYRNRDSRDRAFVSDALLGDQAVILIPKKPLPKGATVSIDSTIDGQQVAWEFFTKG